MNQVCVDANIWIKVLTEETDSPQAQKLVMKLFKEHTEIIAPALMKMEVGSILRKKWSRSLLSQELMQELWRKFITIPIRYYDHRQMYETAWAIAEENRLVHLYDAVYLALSNQIEFWTADERLVRSITQTSAKIKRLTEIGD